ncbi:biotin--[acetyl-CoA-carboxylase] ligase [Occultella glacieicola]|uniref:biotin--[biotin carboxyl-carrier protein] ligase n=1 Tax=Occultella glacieicola TaxID=2518684 RepID=A0ABY2DW98_9MICO|nr:biotin--[acetyl-CoA-carboxylase] ligase [Occultella glacieicola]TDE88003.1 biotin--[acetyl-CoA-carboxylase] ligase [Occultella glacieicola]
MHTPHLRVVESTGSTNADLLRAATADPGGWPHLSGILARHQRSGRGRTGRSWDTDDHAALTFSIVLRPDRPREQWSWLPLLAGVAVLRAAASAAPGTAPKARESAGSRGATVGGGGSGGTELALKWPNDLVHTRGAEDLPDWGRLRKVGGLLAEVLPDASGVVLGIGVNLAGERLPVPWAGTLAEIGVETDAQALAHRIVASLADVLADPAIAADPRSAVGPHLVTLNTRVRVDLPSGPPVQGVAAGLAADGALVVHTTAGERTVHAGDVAHVRIG